MFISLRFVAVVAVFAPFSCAATYFVDPNCDASYSGISQTSFPEAWDMARNALQVANSGNENEQFVYGKLFKEGVKETIKAYFEILGGLTLAAKAEDADLIFDCDNDERWKPVMDGDVQRGEGGNKQWKDEKYHMRVAKEFPSCVRNPPALASTYGRFVRTQGWKDKRTVISLCERLSRSYGNWGTVSKFEDRLFDKILKDPQGKDQNVPSWLDNPCTSRTILHEAFHSNLIEPHKKDIKIADGKKAYGWVAASALTAAEQLDNADNYAVYAFSLFLKGYRIGDTEKEKTKGILVRVADVSKRALLAIKSVSPKCRDWFHRRLAVDCKV